MKQIVASACVSRFEAHDDGQPLRIAGVTDDGRIAIAVMASGAGVAHTEFDFTVDEVKVLAERVLAGDVKAWKTPGLARIFAGAICVLHAAALQGGAIVPADNAEAADADA